MTDADPGTASPAEASGPATRGRAARVHRGSQFDVALGAKVKAARLKADMSQTQLGNAVGVTFQQVQKYERGMDRVAAGTLQKIAVALRTPPASFFDASPAPVGNTSELREVMAAANALQRVRNPLVRQRILALIDELTKDDTPEP